MDADGVTASQSYSVTIQSPTLYWDPSQNHSGTGSGGTGTWNTGTTNWFNGVSDVAWSNAYDANAVFDGGNGGTVSLSTGITAKTLSFTSSGYTITGSTLTLSGDGGSVGVSSGMSETIGSVIAGGSGLALSGGGTLTLTGANSYTAGTTVSAGSLQIGNGGVSGSLGTGGVTDNGSLVFDLSNSPTIANAISGTGSLTQESSSLVLTGANTYSGTTTINSGAGLQIGLSPNTNSGALGTGPITDNGSLTFDINSSPTITSAITGAGSLTQEYGTLTLSNASNSYSGGTLVTASTLAVGASGALGSGTLTLNPGAVLESTLTATLANGFVIGNGGTSTIGGSNSLTLSGPGLFFTGGILSVTNTATTTLSGNLTQNGSGQGLTMNASAGTLIVSGSNNSGFSGTVTLTAGKLTVGAASTALGTGTVALNGGTLTESVAATLTNTFTVGGNATLDGGSNLTLSGNGTLTSGDTLTVTNTATAALSGNLSGAGALTLNATGGTTTLGGTDTYSGATTVSGGTLLVNSSINSSVTVNSGGTLLLNGSINGNVTVNSGGLLSGSGTISGNLSNSGQIDGTAAPTNGLVSRWSGNGNANDSVGSNNGTLVNSVGFAPGQIGQAFSFNGSNYVQIPTSPSLNPTTQVTLEAWINPSASLPERRVRHCGELERCLREQPDLLLVALERRAQLLRIPRGH